jgi:uncharacterized membrane protein
VELEFVVVGVVVMRRLSSQEHMDIGQKEGTWLQLVLHQAVILVLPDHAPIATHCDKPLAVAGLVVMGALVVGVVVFITLSVQEHLSVGQ